MFDSLRIYVADLAAHDSGFLKGGWIDVEDFTEVSEIWEEIEERGLLGRNGDEWNEWAIHNHEGFDILYSEHMSFDTIMGIVQFKADAEAQDLDWDVVLGYVKTYGRLPNDVDKIADSYQGHWSTFQEFAENFFDKVYGHEVPEFILNYIDYEAFARDLALYYFEVDTGNGVHIFRNC